MSDTPRTDAESFPDFEKGGDVVLAEFARALERELAEALAQRDEWFSVLAKKTKELGDVRESLAAAIRDRDNHLATINQIRKDMIADESFGKVVQTLFQDPLDEMERERDALANAIRSFVTDFERIQGVYDEGSEIQHLVDALFESLTTLKP